MTDLFLLLCTQAIVFGVHIFTFHITIFLLFYDMKIGIQAIFKYTRHPTLKNKQTNQLLTGISRVHSGHLKYMVIIH